MTNISILPKDDKTNGWSRILPSRDIAEALNTELNVDYVIIGAGFAGLAAARRLAENQPNSHIALLEAHEVGEGASGRNSGFAIDLPHNVESSLQELDGSQRFIRLSRAAIDYLQLNITKQKITCNWSQRGKYHAAVSDKGSAEILQPYAQELDALGETYRWVNREQLLKEIGTDYFHSALYTPGGYLMNPAALTRGLADSLPPNVTLFEHTPVLSIEHTNGIKLTTPEGNISAHTAILAVNGFASQFGFLSESLMVLAAYASLTRPLTSDERTALGGVDDWGLTPVNSISGVTMRLTQDNRILMRQCFRYAPNFRRPKRETFKARATHQQLFKKRFPILPDVHMEHTWRGFVCMSRNHAPGFGRLGPNVFGAVCQNAVGVTKGTISGLLAADMACGEDNSLISDMESLGSPQRLPPRPFLDLGVRARFAIEMWRGRNER